ncbi:sugar ABC transporter substrate-binding protein, partial [Lactobacillus sp. XV13L]|nr:sugar ABC transporter substrate-binding protein [Lactobacillus sp. XV13L]
MKFWKKIALSSTAVLAAVTLAACSNNDSKSSSGSGQESSKLTLWVDTAQVSYYKQIAKDFTKTHKNIAVRVTQN